jgi:hypothetical protein
VRRSFCALRFQVLVVDEGVRAVGISDDYYMERYPDGTLSRLASFRWRLRCVSGEDDRAHYCAQSCGLCPLELGEATRERRATYQR